MAAKTVLITGANTGLGYESIKSLFQSSIPYKLIMCGRSLEKATASAQAIKTEFPNSSSTITALQLDISSDDSIAAAAAKVAADFGHIDVLVNNAGAAFDIPIVEGTIPARQGWNQTWDTNVTGTHLNTEAFAPLLLKSSEPRLIFITSGTSSLEETNMFNLPVNKAPPKGWPKPAARTIISYRSAKTGLNMLMREWAKILREDGVKVFALAPGFLATGLGNEREAMVKLGAKDPSVGGDSLRRVVEGERDADATKLIRNYLSPVMPY